MQKIVTLALIALTALKVHSQNYEPQILILSPNEFKYDKQFEFEIKKINDKISEHIKSLKKEKIEKSSEFKEQPKNIQQMTLSEAKFTENLEFSKQASLITFRHLTYKFYQRFNNLLVLLLDYKVKGSQNELKSLADKEKMQYVLNFPKIELYQKDKVSFAKVTMQLYDNITQKIIIDKEFEGDWVNHGFDFACEDKSIDCTVNNGLSQALKEVIYEIASNNPTIKREKRLAQQRFDELISKYYTKSYDKDFLKTILPQPDSNIVLENLYQVIINSDKTKFVGFFNEQVTAQDFKKLSNNKKDKTVNIITNGDIKNEGFLDNIPQNYAHIVTGVKYKEKWYFEKSNVTYFEAKSVEEAKQKYFNNLQKWNIFKENSTEFNPSFWETSLFGKVRDLRQDPDWSKYGESSWKTREINDKDYVGLYEIVANQLKKKKIEEDENFDTEISKSLLLPFYDKQIKNKSNDIAKYSIMYEKPTLIYPKERNVILNPILITNWKEEKSIRYFVVIPKDKAIYEWNYFKSNKIPEKTWHYGSEVIKQLEPLTNWNFSVTSLEGIRSSKYVFCHIFHR